MSETHISDNKVRKVKNKHKNNANFLSSSILTSLSFRKALKRNNELPFRQMLHHSHVWSLFIHSFIHNQLIALNYTIPGIVDNSIM